MFPCPDRQWLVRQGSAENRETSVPGFFLKVRAQDPACEPHCVYLGGVSLAVANASDNGELEMSKGGSG